MFSQEGSRIFRTILEPHTRLPDLGNDCAIQCPERRAVGNVTRREVLGSTLALSGAAISAMLGPGRVWGAALDPLDLGVRYGITGSLWGDWPDGNLRMSGDIERIAHDAARVGLQGIELYGSQITHWLDKPLELKEACNNAGVALVDIGDVPVAWRRGTRTTAPASAPGPNSVRPNPWIDSAGNSELIERMVSFARDFLAPCGCDHWKTNMGSRPPGGSSQDQLKRLADTLNEIGRQTIAFGVRLAPHPHIWGPMEREHEVRTVMALTDPRSVWLTLDTGHITLGGMDPVRILSDYFPRVAEVHLKDTYRKYRGNTSTPTIAEHRRASVYHNLGSGGVDFPAVLKVLRERRFKGWVLLDLDPPRPGDSTGTIQDNLEANIHYLRHVLDVRLPAARS